MKKIDKGTRLTNYLIDSFVIYTTWIMIILVTQSYDYEFFIFYSLMFLYYLILESSSGQTLGKLITKTKVVSKNGKKPSFWRVLIRSTCRIIPLDTLSYLFGSELGMHDLVSSTVLTKKARTNSTQQK